VATLSSSGPYTDIRRSTQATKKGGGKQDASDVWQEPI